MSYVGLWMSLADCEWISGAGNCYIFQKSYPGEAKVEF